MNFFNKNEFYSKKLYTIWKKIIIKEIFQVWDFEELCPNVLGRDFLNLKQMNILLNFYYTSFRLIHF